MLNPSDVSFIKRIVVGTLDPAQPVPESTNQAQIDLLNRCLHEVPKGTIMAIEKPLTQVEIGGRTEVVQAVIYHVGFSRRPAWLAD